MSSNVQRLLRATTTTATSLLAIIIDAWDVEALQWEPEVLRDELEERAGSIIPSINMDKIQGLTAALSTPSFYDDFYVFAHICNSLGGIDEKVVFSVFEPPMPTEMAWTVFEINLNDPSDNIADKFHPDVLAFMGFVLREGALSRAPKVLNFVEVPLSGEEDIFAGDPELYTGYQTLLKENTDNVNKYVESRAKQLLAELSNLELENGDIDTVFKTIPVSKESLS